MAAGARPPAGDCQSVDGEGHANCDAHGDTPHHATHCRDKRLFEYRTFGDPVFFSTEVLAHGRRHLSLDCVDLQETCENTTRTVTA